MMFNFNILKNYIDKTTKYIKEIEIPEFDADNKDNKNKL